MECILLRIAYDVVGGSGTVGKVELKTLILWRVSMCHLERKYLPFFEQMSMSRE